MLGGIHKAVLEVIPGSPEVKLSGICSLYSRLRDQFSPRTEINTLTRFYFHFKKAGRIKILLEFIASFHFLLVLDIVVPVRDMYIFVVLGKLHEKIGIALVHPDLDAVKDLFKFLVSKDILPCQGMIIPESQERSEPKLGGRMCFNQGVFDNNPVFLRIKQAFTIKNNPSDTKGQHREGICCEVPDVFMSLGIVHIPRVFVYAEVEFRITLYYGLINCRKQNMHIMVYQGLWSNQQTMVFSCVAVDDCCVGI